MSQISSMPKSSPLTTQVWIDLETTGLSVLDDQILELGIVITPNNYQGETFSFVELFPLTAYSAERLNRNDFVRNMHTENDLLQEIAERFPDGDNYEYQAQCELTQTEAINWLTTHGLANGEFEMCGASVHFDRAWLREDMPLLEAWFHYRNFDVSTLKRACEIWYPTFYNEMFPEHDDMHRAIRDCYDEIGEAKIIRMFFDGLERITNK